MDARMGSGELALWKAKVQVDNFVTDAMQRRKGGPGRRWTLRGLTIRRS